MGDRLGVRYNIAAHADDFEIYNVATDPQERLNLATNAACLALQQQRKDTVLRLRRPDSTAPRPYDTNLVPALTVSGLKPGLQWGAFPQAFPWVPELRDLPSFSSGVTARPTLTVRPRDDNFGLLFRGSLEVPRDGEYTFYLAADTGALLRLHEAIVIDADYGYAGGTEQSATLKLQAGRHPLRLYYHHGVNGRPFLRWQWSGPGFTKQDVPPAALLCD